MTELGQHQEIPCRRRVFDVAIGIVMGLRGCSERAAFDDLGAAVHHTGIAIGRSGECFGGLGGGSAHVAHGAEAIGG